MQIIRYIFLFFLLLPCFHVFSQNIYTMPQGSAIDCEGILIDSGLGTPAGNYDHNEDYIFTICLPGNGIINFSFSAFCLEEPYDFMYIYDGADTTAPVLAGPLTDAIVPSPVVSTGSCITIYFHSDASVACSGWLAQWTSEIEEPLLPAMTFANTNPTCSTTVVTLNFDSPILCDSVLAGNFSINGAASNSIVNATPLNCVGDSTTSVQLQLSPGLNQSGYYTVSYNTTIVDECGNVWDLFTADTLAVTDCPLFVTLESSDISICQGQCTDIDADPVGGNFLNYNYVWNPPLPNSDGPHQICPLVTTTYTVTVTDGTNAPPAIDTLTIIVLPAPTITSSTTVCQSSPPINLSANPAGGEWDGNGIIDSLAGTFDPSVTGAGTFDVTYYDPNGCPVIFQVTVLPINAGPDEAACPGTAPFLVSGFSPAGGTWSGPNITAGGLFNPNVAGTYTVTYTVGTCSDTKTIIVQNISLTTIDTLCESEPAFNLTFSPIGGTWTGAGITNSYWGTFDADVATEGSHVLTYTIQGCSQSFTIFIKDIEVPWGFTACPAEAPFIISPYPTPPNGVWTNGIGIVNANTGLYNPGVFNVNVWNSDSLVYTVNGCSDYMFAYVVQTTIYTDTVLFCPNDPPLTLEWDNIQNTPWDGVWTGTGVTDPDFPGIFDPAVAGPGTHVLHYMANTCEDSIVMIVRPVSTPNDTSVCEFSPAFALHSVVPNGVWHGNGITDTLAGIFNPQNTGVGVFTITYTTPDGCTSDMDVTVYALPTVQISGLATSYCWKNQTATLSATPAGGTFTGNGITGNVFSPQIAGVGQHIITYTFGSGDCQVTGIAITNVSPPLEVNISATKDTICYGQYSQLTAQATMGGSAAYTYTWSNNLGVGQTKPVNPQTTTTYTVTAKDGCSDSVTASVTIYVNPPLSIAFSVTDTACFGEKGTASVQVIGNSEYAYSWHTTPPQTDSVLEGEVFHDYDVTVTDINTGCEANGNVVIPGFPYVHAAFLSNPTDQCASIISPIFNFIDMSSGASQGLWTFGDGTSTNYVLGEQPSHTYGDTGSFVVTLYIQNAFGCADSVRDTVCVIPENSNLFIPDAFTPNGDNINEEWGVVAKGFERYDMRIFDRWGRLIFASTNPIEKWNGTHKGEPCPEGAYMWRLIAKMYLPDSKGNYRPQWVEKKGTITLIR